MLVNALPLTTSHLKLHYHALIMQNSKSVEKSSTLHVLNDILNDNRFYFNRTYYYKTQNQKFKNLRINNFFFPFKSSSVRDKKNDSCENMKAVRLSFELLLTSWVHDASLALFGLSWNFEFKPYCKQINSRKVWTLLIKLGQSKHHFVTAY